jgi:Ca2+/Na+ antiporter
MLVGLEILGGLIYLLLAGDLLVRGSVALARRTQIPPAVVGLTIVAFGTSAPELFVSVGAAIQGHAQMSVGNVVGSNIANSLMVLGLPALFVPTGEIDPLHRPPERLNAEHDFAILEQPHGTRRFANGDGNRAGRAAGFGRRPVPGTKPLRQRQVG